jgi:hypothetical protein
MKPYDRARLTSALGDHVAKIAADLRAKMRAPGATRTRAQQLHADEQVAEDFDVWTDLLSRRAAVLWVLKSVYVRVLEDRGLLAPGRLLDLEAQQLFERLAPHLGETAFLRWVYRDLASSRGGLPELFSLQPAEVAFPSDELSRALITFWRHRDADTGGHWSFAEERFEGELMGDLYQDLDPVVKDRFALCQTPDFVRAFILDRTLTPAIETFGAEEVRLLDPACGSGHFLIDGLKRLVAATAAKHSDWEREKVVAHTLERVVGVDLNDYACALARARLIMTAAELAGVTSLADAARFHPHVYWADGLEQVEREEQKPSLQFSLFEKVEEAPRATLTRSDVRAALKIVFTTKFHAVVANPPYITETDEARKAYHRKAIGRSRRYVSAYKEYSLGGPFTERCFSLSVRAGFVGLITGNNFTKGDFGKPLVEKVLAGLDLQLLVDASQAYIPYHNTPTILIFGRNRRPQADTVRVCLSGRGEEAIPDDPEAGRVWTSITEGWACPGYQNDFLTVLDMPREQLGRHPWALKGGGAPALKATLERRAACTLGKVAADIGAAVLTRADGAYLSSGELRQRFRPTELRPFVTGKLVRDWSAAADQDILYPYSDVDGAPNPRVESWLWPLQTLLWLRREPNGNHRQIGLPWWGWSRFIQRRYTDGPQLVFSNVSTHNHFALVDGRTLLGSHAPCIRLGADATSSDYHTTLAILNSSVTCFWMRQVSKDKGGGTDMGKWQSDPAKVAYEFSSTRMKHLPMPGSSESDRAALAKLASAMCDLAATRAEQLVDALPGLEALRDIAAEDVARRLTFAEQEEERILRLQVALQEEIDWRIYELFGLVERPLLLTADEVVRSGGAPLGSRPFEMLQARAGRTRGVDGQALQGDLAQDINEALASAWRARVNILERSEELRVVEHESFKRRWLVTPKHLAGRVETFSDRLDGRLRMLVDAATEAACASFERPVTASRLAATLGEDKGFHCLLRLQTGRSDYDIEKSVAAILQRASIPNSAQHMLTDSGLLKRRGWERCWAEQRVADESHSSKELSPPLRYEEEDFLEKRFFDLRGRLDVPRERFTAFTEIPGRSRAEALYGWAGWSPAHRLKAILSIDEDLEDAAVPLVDRIGLLDSAWRLLSDVAREDSSAAIRLKAELQALVGPEGPSRELIEDWKKRFPPPTTRATRATRVAAVRAEAESDNEETDES